MFARIMLVFVFCLACSVNLWAGQCNAPTTPGGATRCLELNSNGTPRDPTDDCFPNDGVDDGQCFQNSLLAGGTDTAFHVPGGEWDIVNPPGNLLFKTGARNFAIFGDGNSSKLVFAGSITMLVAGSSEGYVGDFQIVKAAGSRAIDHIFNLEGTTRVTVNNIEFWLNSLAAGPRVHDNNGLAISNGNTVSNIRVINGRGATAATKGIVLQVDLPNPASFDVRVLGVVAPQGVAGVFAGESALYENGNSGGVWDFIDINPPANVILLDVVNASRQVYQRFLTAPGANSVPLVRIKDSDASDFSHWQIPGNGVTSAAHLFQALAGVTGTGCAGRL